MIRLTKKLIREAKMVLALRIQAVSAMNQNGLIIEHRRVFPYLTEADRPRTAALRRRDLILDALERAIPDQWLD